MSEIQREDTSLKKKNAWVGELILIVVLIIGAYLRFVGLNWDGDQHLHPDERFLTMVSSAITPVNSLSQFFDTANSTLNPHNVGYGFFVYGTFPIFVVRMIAGWIGKTGYDEIFMVGRVLSGIMDLLAVGLVFLIAQRLFRRPFQSVCAAALYAGAVLPIQLSHFFAVDTFANTFTLLAVYFAVRIMTQPVAVYTHPDPDNLIRRVATRDWNTVLPYVLFGVAYGMALASKVSIVPVVIVLLIAAFIAWSKFPADEQFSKGLFIFRNLAVAGLVTFLIFRIGQPYAFTGPGFLGLVPNQKWLDNLSSLAQQSGGDVDMPPALQWANRPITFAWENEINWGLGLPFGIVALGGVLWMGWQMVMRRRWHEFSLIWVWTVGFSLWQGLSFVRAMRYQLPVYPLLAIIAAWMLFELWDKLPILVGWVRSVFMGESSVTDLAPELSNPATKKLSWMKTLVAMVGIGVVLATFAWAFAFIQIYTRPVTRVDASRWIYQNVPGPINLQLQTEQGIVNRPLSYPVDTTLRSGPGFPVLFAAQSDEVIHEVQLPKVSLVKGGPAPVQLTVQLTEPGQKGQVLGQTAQTFQTNLQQQSVFLILDHPVELKKGNRYALIFTLSGEHNTASLDSDLILKTYDHNNQMDLDALDVKIEPGKPFVARFSPKAAGTLSEIRLPVVYPSGMVSVKQVFVLSVIQSGGILIGNATLEVEPTSGMAPPVARLETSVDLQPDKEYLLTIDMLNAGNSPTRLNGQINLQLSGGSYDQVLPSLTHLIYPKDPFQTPFTAQTTANLSGVRLGWAVQQDPQVTGSDTLTITIRDASGGSVLGSAQTTLDLLPGKDQRGVPVQFQFSPPVRLEKDQTYFIQLASQQGAIAIRGSAPANESSWDDPLPLRIDGMDGYSGVYERDLNFEMYWNDDANKLDRFTQTLDQADYVFMSSNRQWGTTTRVPERYPLTIAYYRALLGCPADKTVTWCYSVAEPGMFQGRLGFDLVKVSQSDPNLGPWRFNTQFAEEAFSVYDHPKVMIFQKNSNYSPENVRNILDAVDLSKVIQVTPRNAGNPANLSQVEATGNLKEAGGPTDLMLPADRLSQQREGGTWSELFDRDSILNRWPVVGAVVWYLFIFLLGWLVYPFVRLALGGLADRGYPLARVAGMVILAYLVWLGGSYGVPFTRTTIWLVIAGLLVINLILFAIQRKAIWDEIKQHRKYYLLIEGLFLAFFLLDLLIRLGNPDLWHPAKGGEKPMDFSYLNAVLKSTSFPPYDPWFAGGYINYYYYGFVLIGTWIKALGIVPSVAYNLALPTLFAMVALSAFSIGWNLLSQTHTTEDSHPVHWLGVERRPLLAGLAAATAILILGNLGTINMIWEGFQLLIVPRDVMEKADLFTRMGWTFQGVATYFSGHPLPYNIGEWYWNPSRAIPGEPITEFPFFTFLYADPHAHMMALPVTVLSLAWGLSILGLRWNWGEGRGRFWACLQFAGSFILGGLTIGALYPTNTWDMPAYLVLGCLAVLYTALRSTSVPLLNLTRAVIRLFSEKEDAGSDHDASNPRWLHWILKFVGSALPAVLLLVGLTFLFYRPFAVWYGQGYNTIERWTGARTPLWAYQLHWGLFLFVLGSWLVWETVDWMAKTPVSALNKLRSYGAAIIGGLVFLAMVTVYLMADKVQIAWLPILLGTWVVILILRPGQPDAKRAVLFMTGSALALTLFVDVFVVPGAGRMNTVFKFYLQAWTLFSLSAGVALIWLLPAISKWVSAWGTVWQSLLVFLIGSAALFPLLAGYAKIEDRMTTNPPHTLDGMAYMANAQYADEGKEFNLDEDYRAILWMQENVKGSPVIVETNTPEYRWGSRFTIYTGLPGVVGWNWHQRQQRTLTPSEWVTDRVAQIGIFYNTHDESIVTEFLKKYQVKYIVVGQLERVYYPTGLDKFDQWNGKYWKEVYRDGATAIYEVLQ
jgi:YYY domain-containing protein